MDPNNKRECEIFVEVDIPPMGYEIYKLIEDLAP
jgi:hypothetical protein